VHRVVPAGEALGAADELAEEIASRGPLAVREAKRLIDAATELDLDAGLAAELDASERIFATDDMTEGARAFFEKRDPEYRGR
jgi:enoyl-CoA hydratase/carnithine racemase